MIENQTAPFRFIMTSQTPLTACALTLVLAFLTWPITAQEMVWSGSTDNHWNSKTNWSQANRIPNQADTVVITNHKGNTEIVLDKSSVSGSVFFRSVKLAPCKLTGGSLLLSDRGTIRFQKLPKDVGHQQNASAVIESDLVLAGSLTLENLNRHYLGGEYLKINGKISGTGRITIKGPPNGLVQLSGDNSEFSGPIVIQSGGLKLSHANGIGSGTSPIQLSGGAFVIGARISTNRDFVIDADSVLDSHGANGTHDGTFTIKKDATLKITNGGGNTMTVRGPIVGDGRLEITARGTTFAGTAPNRLTGITTISGDRGPTVFAKQNGINVIAGALKMRGNGTIRWKAHEQIADDSSITFGGRSPSFELNGKRESLGPLNLQSDGKIYLGENTARLRFADSSNVEWNTESSLMIFDANHRIRQLTFGNSGHGVSNSQLKQIGFVNPAGLPDGTYTAKINDKGELTPHIKVVPVNLPFDNSKRERDRRSSLYQIPGLKRISELASTKQDCVISVFGDSITWGGGYVNQIQKAIKKQKTGMTVINHGCNGAGVAILRDGDKAKIHVGNTRPRRFLETIETDKTSVAVVFIGVNDVWWRKTSPGDFETGLRDLVEQAESKDAIVVLATLALLKEKVGDRNPQCDQFAEITRKVARETGATLVDLRSAFFAYLENESITVKPNGHWTSHPQLLTHDGVHMNSRGNELIANLIADGICNALENQGANKGKPR